MSPPHPLDAVANTHPATDQYAVTRWPCPTLYYDLAALWLELTPGADPGILQYVDIYMDNFWDLE